jgi:phosphotransferase system HPr-like phosphotransfer protein
MKKKLHVGASPLTGTIYAGTVLKDGATWSTNRQDVTMDALVAVAQYGVHFGQPIEITCNGKPEYRITVKKLDGAA